MSYLASRVKAVGSDIRERSEKYAVALFGRSRKKEELLNRRKSLMKDKKRVVYILKRMENKHSLLPAKNCFLERSKIGSRVSSKGYKPLILTDFMIKDKELARRIEDAKLFKRRVLGQAWDKAKGRRLNSLGPMTEEVQQVRNAVKA